MKEFDENGKCTIHEVYWSLLSDRKIIEVSPQLLAFLVSQEN